MNIFKSNVSTSEQARRYIIGSAIIGVLLTNPSLPAWIALFACYPIFTAMIQWDPVNFVMQTIITRFTPKHSVGLGNTTTA
jgi:hypothetical protein